VPNLSKTETAETENPCDFLRVDAVEKFRFYPVFPGSTGNFAVTLTRGPAARVSRLTFKWP